MRLIGLAPRKFVAVVAGLGIILGLCSPLVLFLVKLDVPRLFWASDPATVCVFARPCARSALCVLTDWLFFGLLLSHRRLLVEQKLDVLDT